jgi:hypothetical protein
LDSFSGIVLAHLKRYPRMEIQDVYKLAYQAALGAEHAAATLDANNNFLMQALSNRRSSPSHRTGASCACTCGRSSCRAATR